MKKQALLLSLLGLVLTAAGQDTVRTRVEVHRAIIRQTVIDTVAAPVYNDKTALDVRGDVQSVTTRTYDYLNNTVIEEVRQLDEQGYCLACTRKIGFLGGGSYASVSGDAMPSGSVTYTNVITMNNTYKNGKISKVEVQDMERGDYEIYYRYNLSGDVIGHDTVYDGVHHTDYTARYDRYHNLSALKETGGYHYNYSYVYDTVQRGRKLRMTSERYSPVERTYFTAQTDYVYDSNNRLVREMTSDDAGDDRQTSYTYDPNNLVIRKDTKAKGKKFEEIIERDSYGSCVLRQIVQDGKIIVQIFNDVTYNRGSQIVS